MTVIEGSQVRARANPMRRLPGDAPPRRVSVRPDRHASSTTKPIVSVCIPTYNNSATIVRCLRSVLEQEGVGFELLVIDDQSTDDCAAIAATMLRSGDRLIRNETRLGLNQNHNKCLQLARGRYIQFVHGDDWLLPGALQKLAKCFDNPTVGMAFAPRHVLTDDAKWRRRYGRVHTHFWKLREYNHGPSLVTQMVLRGSRGNWIGEPSCVMFRRRLAMQAGGFRNDVYQLVDLDLWLRLILRSAVCFVPQELPVRQHTAVSATNRNITTRRSWLDHIHVLTWMIVDPASPVGIRLIARLWWLPTWLALILEVAVLGPNRQARMKTLALAPFDEFARARRLRAQSIESTVGRGVGPRSET